MKRTVFRSWAGLVPAVLLFLFFAARPALADAPSIVNFQGSLKSGAQPVNASVQMVFRIYDAASGGTALWTETQTVAVNGGIYNVRLGSITPIDLPFDVPYFLGVTVGADAEMTPRQAIASVPYAMRTGCNPGDRRTCYTADPATIGNPGCSPGIRVCNPSGLGWSACSGEVTPNCGASCVNLQTDVNNCGACSHQCAGGQTCTNGVCT